MTEPVVQDRSQRLVSIVIPALNEADNMPAVLDRMVEFGSAFPAYDFELCWPVLRRCFGDVRPAATMLMRGLSDPRMKIEIEVDARRRA